ESSRGVMSTMLLSPDGRHVLARYRNRAYLRPMSGWGLSAPLDIDLNASALPLRKLDRLGADDIAWGAAGRRATWVLGNTLFHVPVDGIPADSAVAAVDDDAGPVASLPIEVSRPRAHPRGAVLLSGARVISMKGDEVIDAADLLVVDNRIAALGRQGTLDAPPSARRIDVSGATIVPG